MAINLGGLQKTITGGILKATPLGLATDLAKNLGLGKVAGAVTGLTDALGLTGKTEADKRRDRERAFTQAIRECYLPHIEKTVKPQSQGGTRWPGLRKGAQTVADLIHQGASCSAVQRMWAGDGGAAMRNGRPYNFSPNQSGDRQWQSSNFTATAPAAPLGTQSFGLPQTQGQGSGSAQPATGTGSAARPKRPCAYGPRDEVTGFCPRKGQGAGQAASASSTQTQAAPKALRPCAYGPRDEAGFCPPRPRSGADGTSRSCAYGERLASGLCPKKPRATAASRKQGALERRAEAEVTAGLKRGAAAVIKTVGPGNLVKVIAKGTLVGAAGLAAYWLTSQAMKLRFKTWEDIRYEVARLSGIAKQNVRRENGRDLTPQEIADFNAYYRSRVALIDQLIAAGESPTHFDPIPFIFED